MYGKYERSKNDRMSVALSNLKKEVTEKTRSAIHAYGAEVDDEKTREMIEEVLFSLPESEFLSSRLLARTADRIFCQIRRELGILAPLAEDGSITEIMVNGPDHIFIEKDGKISKSEYFFDTTEELEEVIRRIAAHVHREINEMVPILDARLENGDRVNAVYKNIALGGPSLSIRKFPKKAMTMEMLIESGSITNEAAVFLEKIVRAGYNCFISGGTSSGKTTFLNVLSGYIPKNERIVVIEDSAELQLSGAENLVRMECRNANLQGKGEIDLEMLIRTSLRMRPDRIIVGEVRGGECMEMLQAMNTGHSGMSTGHANSANGMLRRLEAMYLQKASFPIEAIREQIAQGIDILIHLGRVEGKGRKVMEITEIQGLSENKFILNKLFEYKFNGCLTATGNRMARTEKLEMAGIVL